MTGPKKMEEIEKYLEELERYRYLRVLGSRGELKRSTRAEIAPLRDNLLRGEGRLRSLITELTGKEKIKTVGKGDEYSYDMWAAALRIEFNKTTLNALNICIDTIKRAIGKLESDISEGVRDKQGKLIEKLQKLSSEPPKAFIAHGGESPALRKLESYLEALGIQPLVVEEQPSGGRSIAENVDYYARQSDSAIILATKGDVDGKTGGFIPRGNVLMEIGKLQELLKDRIVYLVQAGTKLPTNISEKVRVRFSPQSMDDSFIKIAKELKKFGILKAVKPQNGASSSSGDVAPSITLP